MRESGDGPTCEVEQAGAGYRRGEFALSRVGVKRFPTLSDALGALALCNALNRIGQNPYVTVVAGQRFVTRAGHQPGLSLSEQLLDPMCGVGLTQFSKHNHSEPLQGLALADVPPRPTTADLLTVKEQGQVTEPEVWMHEAQSHVALI